MGKDDLSKKYELVMIVDARLSAEEKKNISREASDAVSKAGGKIINTQLWLDKHKLTFVIKKATEGSYYLINFESETSAVEKIRAGLKLNEKILRFVIIHTEAAPAAPVTVAAAS